MKIRKQIQEIKPGDLVYSIFDKSYLVLDNKFIGLSYFNNEIFKMICLSAKGNIVDIQANADKCYTLLNDRS